MESLAESGHIYLSENTAQLVEGFFELSDLGRSKVKGVEAPIGLFDLEGVGAFRTRLDRSRARGLSTFVGREGDMAVLEGALERAQSSGGQVLGVSADAGTGKSRLCAEFVDKCRARGIPVHEARGVAHGKSVPMLPMLELWRSFYGIAETDGPEATRAKIAGRLLLMDESFREMLPVVFDVFGVPDPTSPAPSMDPEQRQKRLRAVVKQVLHDPAYGGTRILLLEDLHWFDGASDGFLETIVESAPATRDLLLVNFRPEYSASWMQRSYYQHLPLQPLEPEALRELLRAELGDDPSVARLPKAIHERTKGNPFFTEEVVQSMLEAGHLVGERGAYRLTTTVDTLEVPASVQSVLAARIDRLPDREKQVLQMASAIGKTFPEALLRPVVDEVAGLDERVLGRSLSELTAAEFLFEASLYPQLEYSFKHPLTQEVAQGSQLRERRVRIHAAVAGALEGTGGNLDERAAEIAQHWAEAEESTSAARWHRRAAEWAGLSDPREGLRHWRRVRDLAAQVEDEAERDELALQACIQIMQLGWRMGGSEEESESVFSEGRALAERSGDRNKLARVVGFYGLVRNMQVGSATDYIRYGSEGAAIAAETDDAALRAAIGTLPAFGHLFGGDGREMVEWASRVLEVTGADNELGREISGYSPRAAMLHARAMGLSYIGRLEEARIAAGEAERAAEASAEQEVLGWVLSSRTWLHYWSGGGASRLDAATRCNEIAERIDNESSRVVGRWALGLEHTAAGNYEAARDVLLEGVAIARAHRAQLAQVPSMLGILAKAHLALGEAGEARATAREAIELARAGGADLFEAHAQVVLAEALLESEDAIFTAEVDAALERADRLVDSIGARLLLPSILETRARLVAARGDDGAARQMLGDAISIYNEIGAPDHAERLAAGP
jgi:adenylate cyclase